MSTDHLFWRKDGRVYSDRAFPTFVAATEPHFERLVMFARVHPQPAEWHYEIPPAVEVQAMPWVDARSSAATTATW